MITERLFGTGHTILPCGIPVFSLCPWPQSTPLPRLLRESEDRESGKIISTVGQHSSWSNMRDVYEVALLLSLRSLHLSRGVGPICPNWVIIIQLHVCFGPQWRHRALARPYVFGGSARWLLVPPWSVGSAAASFLQCQLRFGSLSWAVLQYFSIIARPVFY